MGLRRSEHKEQLMEKGPELPGRADVGVRCRGCPVQPLAPAVRQPDGEVLLVPLPSQGGLQLRPQVRHQAQEEERAPV